MLQAVVQVRRKRRDPRRTAGGELAGDQVQQAGVAGVRAGEIWRQAATPPGMSI